MLTCALALGRQLRGAPHRAQGWRGCRIGYQTGVQFPRRDIPKPETQRQNQARAYRRPSPRRMKIETTGSRPFSYCFTFVGPTVSSIRSMVCAGPTIDHYMSPNIPTTAVDTSWRTNTGGQIRICSAPDRKCTGTVYGVIIQSIKSRLGLSKLVVSFDAGERGAAGDTGTL